MIGSITLGTNDMKRSAAVFDHTAGLTARRQLDDRCRLEREGDDRHAIAIWIGDDRTRAIARDEHRAAGERNAPRGRRRQLYFLLHRRKPSVDRTAKPNTRQEREDSHRHLV